MAERSDDARARRWLASLYNNIGQTWLERGDYARALECFRKALVEREARGDPGGVRVARWMVARAQRSLGALDDAEAIQRALLAEYDRLGETDGYVVEELAEIALARGDAAGAQAWAARAHAALKDDPAIKARGARAPRAAGAGRGRPGRFGEAMNPQKRRAIFERLRAANPHPKPELAYRTPVRAAGGGRALGAGDRQGRQQGDGRAVPRGQHARRDRQARRRRPDPLRAVDRALPQQGEEHRRALRDPAARARRRGAGRPRGAGAAARRGAQDRQRGAQHRVRAADDRRRHAHLPRRQPHGPRPGQERRRGRAEARSSSSPTSSGSTRTTG